jgi:hypothetical protein
MKHGGTLPQNKATVGGGWTFEGCHMFENSIFHQLYIPSDEHSIRDNVNAMARTLSERIDIPAGVTIERCTAQCAARGFSVTGLEYGQECCEYFANLFLAEIEIFSCTGCGSDPIMANTSAPLGDCSMACKADNTELCGAADRLSVYINNSASK